MDKEFNEQVNFRDESDRSDYIDTVVGEKKGTVSDVEDMKRLGKEQLFKVRLLPSLIASHRTRSNDYDRETSTFLQFSASP